MMGALNETKGESSFARIDSACASIATRLAMMCDEFIKTDEPQKALAAYHQARDILDSLGDRQKHNVDLGLTLTLLHLKIGDLMRARGDLGQASAAYQSSLAIAERIAALNPGDEDHRRNQAKALTVLSTVINRPEPKLDFGPKTPMNIPSLREALTLATASSVDALAPGTEVEASAEDRQVDERSCELPLEVGDGTAHGDLPSQFIHNIPRRMRVGVLEPVEVRISRRQGHEAITVRLRSPEGGFLIDPLSPETCWTNEVKCDGTDYVSWLWKVTPQRRGQACLHLLVSTQVRNANGVATETAFPDQVIRVCVRLNHGRAVRKVASWALLMIGGGATVAWGSEIYPVVFNMLAVVRFFLGWWM